MQCVGSTKPIKGMVQAKDEEEFGTTRSLVELKAKRDNRGICLCTVRHDKDGARRVPGVLKGALQFFNATREVVGTCGGDQPGTRRQIPEVACATRVTAPQTEVIKCHVYSKFVPAATFKAARNAPAMPSLSGLSGWGQRLRRRSSTRSTSSTLSNIYLRSLAGAEGGGRGGVALVRPARLLLGSAQGLQVAGHADRVDQVCAWGSSGRPP